ncbi:glycosyltransferase [Winogradskyella alexanderae]|uniref:Glycosyltransferase family 4 protein n=1 Tax=Winogradskyella alexanderae TaxID=2877123 RepID=A0ABS7XQF2_9FLAO|nr:glycosyltransferase [Winogradskyella alexanderae]MCA0132243.1 glycosyltransferase family 4 protein [Winogradskyella alexanderae]
MTNKLLIIGFVWPEPKSSAAGSRMLQLIEHFKDLNYEITFCSIANRTSKSFNLETLGIAINQIELNNSSFDVFIKRLNPDVVLFDRFMTEEQFGWRVLDQCPNAIRILDTEDLHGLRKGRGLAIKANEDFDLRHLFNDFTKREIASIYKCDLSLIISTFEMEILTERFKIDPSILYYIPFLVNQVDDQQKARLPEYEDRLNFLIIGNFLHQPNLDSVRHLKTTIWPLIRKQLPDTQLHVYGAYDSAKVTQMHSEKEGFLIKGFADDVHGVMQKIRVSLAPLRYGAGLKGKVFDAFKNGTPCMMSTIASEGILETDEAPLLIDDDPNLFAKKAIDLYMNSKLWYKAQQLGFDTLKSKFTREDFEQGFLEKLNAIRTGLKQHREKNFIGQMLLHQSMQSTKYMSKWIEEKNK